MTNSEATNSVGKISKCKQCMRRWAWSEGWRGVRFGTRVEVRAGSRGLAEARDWDDG